MNDSADRTAEMGIGSSSFEELLKVDFPINQPH